MPSEFGKSHFTFSFRLTSWRLGEKGETCNIVCGKRGRYCRPNEQSKITSEQLVRDAMYKDVKSCKIVVGPRDFPGTPFFIEDICVYLTKGARVVCDENKNYLYRPLCHC